MVLFLLGLLIALGAGFGRSAKDGVGTRAGAMLVADQLRALRQRAMTSGHPTAVALPSNNGTVAVANTLQVLQGEASPRLVRVATFANDSGPVQLYLGAYNGPTWSSTRPQGLLGSAPNLTTWNQNGPQDPVLYFAPDGTVYSNVDHDQGRYRLVVAQQIQAVPGNLSAVYKPYTVSVSLLGAVEVEAGLSNGSSTLVSASPFSGSASGLPGTPPNGNSPPSFVAPYLSVSPLAEASTLPTVAVPGSNYTVPLDGYLTVECFASDSDGDPLFCNWTASGPQGSGSFSSPLGNRMSWDSTRGCWVGRWSWRPPKNASAMEQYVLNCTVYDGHNGVANSAPISAITPKASTIVRRKIAYKAVDADGEGIWVCNWDGSNAHRIIRASDISPTAANLAFPHWSWDNKTIAFVCDDGPSNKIMACTPGGLELRCLVDYPSCRPSGLEWDPGGSYLYAFYNNIGTGEAYIKKWDTSTLNQSSTTYFGPWPTPAAYTYSLSVTPNGKTLLLGFDGIVPQSWVVWTDYSNSPGKREILPYIGSEPCFDCATPAGSDRIVAHLGLMPNETLQQWPLTLDPVTCTTTLGTATPLYPGLTGFQSPCVSDDRQWILGQCTSSGTPHLCLLDNLGNPMVFNLPGTLQDDAGFSH